MLKLSNSALVGVFTKLLVLLVVAKAISLSIWSLLPSDGVELSQKESYQPKYQRVDFKNMLQTAKIKTQNTDESKSSSVSISITNMILKGLYGTSTRGYAIVALKSSAKKTSIVGVGEEFSGFVLKSIKPSSVIFTKSNTEYTLALAKPKANKSFIKKVNKKENSASSSVSSKDVSRTDIAFYSKNPKQLWKDIAIKEVKNGKKIEGFKVTRINKDSKMATLGLRKGDLIIKVNNVALKSYKAAMDIYAKIDKIDTIQIVVMRNNEEKELVYEIN